MNINQKIKHQRELQKISQEFLACELGISQSQYSRRENGTLRFTIEETIKIAKILDLSLGTLVEPEIDSDKKNGSSELDISAFSKHLINQYEARLNEKEEIISLLKEKVNSLKNGGIL